MRVGSVRKAIVHFIVLLTVLSLSITLVPSAFSQPENIKILSYNWYIDSLGGLVVVGEVQNVGPNTIARAIIGGTVYASDGTPADSISQAWAINLAPQQKAPFYMDFYSANDVADLELTVLQADATANYQYPDVKIVSHSSTVGSSSTDKGAYWVSGTLQNTGSQTAKKVRVIGTFYNDAGDTVAVGGYISEVVVESLAPSATASFKFGARDRNQSDVTPSQRISKYSLLVQVEEPVFQGIAPVPTPYEGSSSPGSTEAPSETQTPISNSDSAFPTELIYAVVAVAVVLGVAAILVIRKRGQPTKRKSSRKR